MWPFNRAKTEPNQVRQSPALLDIAERMDRLERIVRDIQTDWESQYDKFHRLNMRLAKRQKALEESEDGGNPAPENGSGDTNTAPLTHNPLAQALLSRGRIR